MCHARSVHARDITLAQFQAHAWAQSAKAKYGAGGFQIRWLDDDGRIVFVEAFDGAPASLH